MVLKILSYGTFLSTALKSSRCSFLEMYFMGTILLAKILKLWETPTAYLETVRSEPQSTTKIIRQLECVIIRNLGLSLLVEMLNPY